MRSCLLLLSLLLSVFTEAQSSVHDSVYNSFHGKISLAGGLDSRNSFVNNRRAHIWGIKAAAEFGELVQLGIGYNRLDDDLTRMFYFTNTNGQADSSLGKLHMDYISWYARYVFYRKGRWKFSVIPFQLGVGRSRYFHSEAGENMVTNKSLIVVYESGFSISFRIFRWLGVGSDVGVRYMVKKNPDIPYKFNSPQYAFYTIIYWSEIVKMAFPHSGLAEKL